MPAIERDSPTPYYYQLQQLLNDRIANGEWQPGEMLPTEEQLQQQYELSRTTVRQALRELELEGKIVRYRGRGTFVTEKKISHSPDPQLTLTGSLLQKGVQPGWRVLTADWCPAPADVAGQLNIKSGEEVFRLRRLRLASQEPIGYHTAFAIGAVARNVDQMQLADGGSLDYLRRTGKLANSYAYRTIEAVLASSDVGELLQIDRGSAILMIRRVVYDEHDRPVEYMVARYRGDRLQYRVRPQHKTAQREIQLNVVRVE